MSHIQNEKQKLEGEYKNTLPGNGAQTCDYYKVEDVPERFNKPDTFKGYDKKMSHPMYMTSAMDYGSRKPTVHVMPQEFHAKSQKFSAHLGQCGMYRNNSLNTSVDKSPVSSTFDGIFQPASSTRQ